VKAFPNRINSSKSLARIIRRLPGKRTTRCQNSGSATVSGSSFRLVVNSHTSSFGPTLSETHCDRVQEVVRKRCEELERRRSGFGDRVVLVARATADTDGSNWQFNRPEQGDGMVQAFRREKSDDPTKSLRLRGLDAAAAYEVTDLDAGVPKTISGRDLKQKGLHVQVAAEPGAAIIIYKRVR
jgi:hypothetical protein